MTLFFSEGTINATTYLEILQKHAILKLEVVEGFAIFKHDSAPSYCGKMVHNALSLRFPGHWVGQVGLALWPVRSSRFTHFDFFFGVMWRVASVGILSWWMMWKNSTCSCWYCHTRDLKPCVDWNWVLAGHLLCHKGTPMCKFTNRNHSSCTQCLCLMLFSFYSGL
jgi:hypothetical protein